MPIPNRKNANKVEPRPTVSVIMPVFNGGQVLERAIHSVLNQKYRQWELLAVDDGSKDDSHQRLTRWATKDTRIRTFRSSENRGPSAARNQALCQARGDIITYLDCFDEYSNDYLEHVQAWPTEADVCLFCYEMTSDEPGAKTRRRHWDPALVWQRLPDANIACPLSIAHLRRLLDRCGPFEEKLRCEEDWDLLKRFARAGACFQFQTDKSGMYHVRPGTRERTRRLADQAWQTDNMPAAPDPSRQPLLIHYSEAPSAGQETAAQADALVARGTTLAQEGNRAEAINLFRQALSLRPDHPRAHHNLGVALAEEKKFNEALECFRAAVRCHPSYAEAHYSVGNTLRELNRDEEAAAAFREAIHYKPDFLDALNNLGVILTRLRRGNEAAIYLKQAVRLKPDFGDAHNNLGLAYVEQGQLAAAEACYEEALRLNPRHAEAHTNLGSAFKEQGRPEEAVAAYELALALEPESVSTRWNRSLAWLQMGNFAQGWPEYEWRWKRKGTVVPSFPQPRWNGAPLQGKTILLLVEQGFGDMMQFLRYAPLIKERGGTVILAAPPPLMSLFATCPGIDQVVPDNQPLPPFDVYAPLMSLPLIFETTLATIPANVPYLSAEPAKLEQWRQRLREVSGFSVGIAWQGNPLHKWDRHRSFPLAYFEPLSQIDGVSLVSIQKGHGAEQLALLRNRFHVLDLGSDLAEFTDTAAIMKCLDLVVCCDTSVAHLAGSLGVPVWVALSTIVDWRWLLNRDDNPWYPTMRLVRQERFGEWQPVFQRMAQELQDQLVRPTHQVTRSKGGE
jgi:tetratricopeptide (TPR) repeat protein